MFLEIKSFKFSADDSEEQNSCSVLWPISGKTHDTAQWTKPRLIVFLLLVPCSTTRAAQQKTICSSICMHRGKTSITKVYASKSTLHSEEKIIMMVLTIRTVVILLSFACCCHLREFYSSYFTFSVPRGSHEESEAISEFKTQTELACALRCSAKGNCDEATFNRDSKKCSLYQKEKDSTEPYEGDDNTPSRILNMRKVSNKFLTVLVMSSIDATVK